MFVQQRAGGCSFEDWVMKYDFRIASSFRVHPLDQLDLIGDPAQYDFVGRFEDMPATYRWLVEQGCRVCRVPGHLKASARDPYPLYYSPDMVLALWERCRPEIEAFGYHFDEDFTKVPPYLPTVRELAP